MDMRAAFTLDPQYVTLASTLGYVSGNRFAPHADCKIISALQPIYSIAHRRIVGLEGLARGISAKGHPISPLQLFAEKSAQEIIALDRVCQLVHVENFSALNPPSAWLFLNIDPKTLSQREHTTRFLQSLLQEKNYPANRIVIEVLESTIADEAALEQDIQEYRRMGFLIAIDDFGSGQSNFERIWRIKPDIVKIDRGMIRKAGVDPSVKRLVKGITTMLHNCKCIVLAEGIETEEEAVAAMEGGVDLVQGFYFAHPFLLSESIQTRSGMWRHLYEQFDHLSRVSQERYDALLAPYVEAFTRVTTSENRQDSLNAIADQLLTLPKTIRLYQLGLDGNQCFSNIDSKTIAIQTQDRLRAFADTQGASWKRRDYFSSASNNPGIVQVTAPYFSISDGTLCITLSVLTRLEQAPFIVCCDVLWEENHA